jgi:hypothetical protein
MHILRRCILAAIICLAGALASSGQDTSKNLYYIINYAIHHCNAEVELNGVPVTKTNRDTAYTVTGVADVGMWLVPGANVITVTVRPPEGAVNPEDRHSIEVTVSTALKGQMSDEGTNIATLRLPEKEGGMSPGSVVKTVKKELRFTPGNPPPSELWTKAKPVPLDSAAREAILGLVKDYHAAYVRKDRVRLHDMLLFAALEAARTRYYAEKEARKMLESGLAEMLSDRNFAMEPLKIDRIVMKPIADGRVIRVTDENGDAPVRTKKMNDGGLLEFPVYAARIDGKWMLVR